MQISSHLFGALFASSFLVSPAAFAQSSIASQGAAIRNLEAASSSVVTLGIPPRADSSTKRNAGRVITLAIGAVTAFTAYKIFSSQKRDEGPKYTMGTPPPLNWNNYDPIKGDEDSFKTSEYGAFDPSLELIDAASIYARGAQGHGVKVGILDTGVKTDHVDLEGRVDFANSFNFLRNPKEYEDFFHPGDFNIEDRNGHGTHVAGIIGGAKNNQGNHGVAFGSELVIFRGIPTASDESTGFVDYWGETLNRSAAAGVGVINNSWSYVHMTDDSFGRLVSIPITFYKTSTEFRDTFLPSTIDALNNAVSSDILLVHSAGNDGADQVSSTSGVPVHMPEYSGYFITAVATDQNRNIAGFSNRCGVAMDFCLAAPGANILSAGLDGKWERKSGTSMAAPFVTGAAAVLRSQFPELTAPQISDILFDTALDLGEPGTDPVYGRGFLNLKEAQAPQGDVVVYKGDSTKSSKDLLRDTAIVASPALASALTSALATKELMVGDRYDRGFFIQAEKLVTKRPSSFSYLPIITRSEVSKDLTILSSEVGLGFEYTAPSFSYSFSRGETSAFDTIESEDPLTFLEKDFDAEYRVSLDHELDFLADVSGSFQNSSFISTSMGIETDVMGALIAASVGALDESGSVLGSQFLGAAGSGVSSRTNYLKISGDFDFSDNSRISVSGSRSDTNFSTDGLVKEGRDLRGTSGKIAFTQKNLFGVPGSLTASVSVPLEMSSGSLHLDIPVARQASENGASSETVLREVSSVEVTRNPIPIDIGFTYEHANRQKDFSMQIHGGQRSVGQDQESYIGFNLSHTF